MSPSWHQGDLTSQTAAPSASGDPAGYMFDAQGTQHVVYRSPDSHIQELWWDAAGGWHHGDLTAATGAPAAASDPAGYMFDTQETQHVVFRSGDGHIRELWWDAAGGWHHGDLTAATGAPNAVGNPAGYVFDAQETQHVMFRGADGHIHELWWDAAGGWHHGDLSAATGAPAAVGDPAGYMFDAQGTQHVVYRSGDSHIRELWWDAAGGWHHGDLTAATGAPAAAGDPAGYMFDVQGTQHVVYRSGNGHIQELWWDAAGGWQSGDLTAATGGPNAVGNPAGYVFDAQGTQHVVYRDGPGHIQELWWDAAGGWHVGDLTAATGAPTAAGDPAGYVFDAQGTQHVVYRDGTGHIQELWWDGAAQQLFVRREVWGLESATTFDPITLAYAKAVQVMQARPASDPTSWSYQAAIHASYTTPPPGANWNACQHQGWYFLPWHRMYLYYFERIVRKAVIDAGGPADWALPYWNYDRPFPSNTLPPAFRTVTLPDGTPNPLFLASPRRSAALMSGGQVPSTATSASAAMASTDFSLPSTLPSFGGGQVGPAHFGGAVGLLEQTPHNVMHTTIGGALSGQCGGGLMTDPACAALDPIFWLHHANIDRLWNNWLALGGGRANPPQAAWLTQSFVLYDENGAQVTLTGADVVDTAAQLGYIYDDVPTPLAAMPEEFRMQRPSPRAPELVAASQTPLVLVGDAASVALTVPASSRGALEEAARSEARRLFVTVDDIQAEEDPGVAYAVFLTGARSERYHIGNISLFGIRQMNDPNRPHDGAPGFRHSFEVTDAVRALRAQGLFDPGSITVTFDPIRVQPPPGGAFTAEVQVTGPVPRVRIGRVSLFVA